MLRKSLRGGVVFAEILQIVSVNAQIFRSLQRGGDVRQRFGQNGTLVTDGLREFRNSVNLVLIIGRIRLVVAPTESTAFLAAAGSGRERNRIALTRATGKRLASLYKAFRQISRAVLEQVAMLG